MKRIIAGFLIFSMVLVFTGCDRLAKSEKKAELEEYASRIEDLEREIEELKREEENPAPVESVEVVLEATPEPTPTPTPIGMSDVPVGNPRMFSSFAYMVSYDPARGWADFDYFEKIEPPEAIDALVDYEGYTYADAQVEVNNWHEGDFYEKNTNTRLRTIDLKTTDIRLILNTDGTLINDIFNPPPATVEDVFNLYNANPHYLFKYFFYDITVDDAGNVTKVEQVYRP